jgi:fibronectin type 3 domain-containing protein
VSILFGGRTLDSTRDSVYKDDTWAYHYQTNAPSPPRNLQGLLADGEISLSWETPSTEAGSPITNYVLYRGSDADSLAEYATVQGKETVTFVDTEVSQGNTYFYAVRAKNAIGESKNSNVVDINIPGGAPGFSILILSFSLFTYIMFKRK